MMAITQWNLVFAHVLSMRPIGDLEANGEVERLHCDPSRYIEEFMPSQRHAKGQSIPMIRRVLSVRDLELSQAGNGIALK